MISSTRPLWPCLVLAASITSACTDPAAVGQLEEAIRQGDARAVEEHLHAGVPANVSLPDGWSPLTLAAHLGHLETVNAIADAGADLEHARRVGVERQWTPLGWAAHGGHGEVVQSLLARGARLEARSSRHQTPLMAAALGGHREIMALLVDAGADQQATDAAGLTAREMLP